MEFYTVKCDASAPRTVVADDMMLTRELPTSAGSRMLDGYVSLLEAEALTRLKSEGYSLVGKAKVGEFAFDVLGESSYGGACVKDGALTYATTEILKSGEATVSLALDVNGAPRRAAAQSGTVCVKPTYGTVSRFGTVPVACSGETVSVSGLTADACAMALSVIAGHDDKDGTSLPSSSITKVSEASPVRRVAILSDMTDGEMAGATEEMKASLTAMGVEVEYVSAGVIKSANAAWNILMCAELCNNVSRYDGVKYGYRAESFSGIDELYTNSRTEAFGTLLKTAILYGSDALSTENYMKIYDKALRTRRVICDAFSTLFESYDAVMLPAASVLSYKAEDITAEDVFTENRFTAPASVTGLPAVVFGGVQFIGKAFSEMAMLKLAKAYEEVKR